MKPHQTLRNILVHPKDKQYIKDRSEVVYQIPCKNCEKVYMGESGRKFGTRLGDHRKDCESKAIVTYTRSVRKQSESTYEKSAKTDHQNIENHEIDWEEAKIIEREGEWRTRKIKEAIQIRTQPAIMDRNPGAFLSRIYDPIFVGLPKIHGNSCVYSCVYVQRQSDGSEDVHSVGRNCQQ